MPSPRLLALTDWRCRASSRIPTSRLGLDLVLRGLRHNVVGFPGVPFASRQRNKDSYHLRSSDGVPAVVERKC